MKIILKSLLFALLFLSTDSISMEVEHSQCACVDCHGIFPVPVIEEGCHYFPLFRVDDRENKPNGFDISVQIGTMNNSLPELFINLPFWYHLSTAYVYLKVSEMAMKLMVNISNGEFIEGIKVVESPYDGELEYQTNEGKFLGMVKNGFDLHSLKDFRGNISIVAFDWKLSSEVLMSSLSIGEGAICIDRSNIILLRNICKCTTQSLSKCASEELEFEPCQLGAYFRIDPFDLETKYGLVPGTKLYMYPNFDLGKAFMHIKDIFLIQAQDMLCIDNSSFQVLPKDVIKLIIGTYSSIVQNEFKSTGKMIYQSELKNIKNAVIKGPINEQHQHI